jgi:ubiquinone/menaquinone biosynthesis C-methylase UbiE
MTTVLWLRYLFDVARDFLMNLRNKLHSGADRILARTERAAASTRVRLKSRNANSRPTSASNQIERPNQTQEWERVYADETIKPVLQLNTPVARAIEGLTRPGDILLETGCGSASISAELAWAGREVWLLDFSQPILDRAEKLFAESGLSKPHTTLSDLTSPLPFDDRSVDVVWSSGVLEHWTDRELGPMVKEMARVSRRAVISIVPNAGCLFYRWGKSVLEEQNRWPYGRELPRASMKGVFEQAGLRVTHESVFEPESSLYFLGQVNKEFQKLFTEWWRTLPADDAIQHSLGYLLLTVGVVDSSVTD